MANIKNNKKGYAIVLALIVASLLLLSSFYLSKTTTQTININQKSIAELQTQFAVKSGMQHAMLKVMLMPTQLYDAAAFSVGKNPYFDFTEYAVRPNNLFPCKEFNDPQKNGTYFIKKASNLNPGPRFIAHKDSDKYSDSDLGGKGEFLKWSVVKNLSSFDKTKPGHVDETETNGIQNPDLYLWKYYKDIKFNSAIDTIAGMPAGFYPYEFNYEVINIKMAAQDEQRKYSEEAVSIDVNGITKYKGESTGMSTTTIVRIKRNE